MSDFDSNPFADPEANPFANPTSTSNAAADPALDDYNPFDKQATQQPTPRLQQPTVADPAPVAAASEPTVYNDPVPQPPPYTPSAAQHVDTTELQKRQEELERKAQELQERENRLRLQAVSGEKTNNFPPIPDCIPVKSCFYQDIDMEIPPEAVRITKFGYYLWIVHAITYTLNFLFAIGYLIVGGPELGTAPATSMGLSVLWFILFVPMSFMCWFRPLYKAFRSDSSINFFFFFIADGIQIIIDIVCFLGPPSSGYVGLLTATQLNKTEGGSRNLSYILFFMTAIFCVLTACDVYLISIVHKIYRRTDASFAKAQAELASGALRNEAVRSAGTQIATDAAVGAMTGGTSNRY